MRLFRGINRNIVECKVFFAQGRKGMSAVLIETLWNVKSYAYQNFCEMYEGINRNIVECKGSPRQTERPGSHSINRNIVECKVLRHLA